MDANAREAGAGPAKAVEEVDGHFFEVVIEYVKFSV